MTRTTSTRVKTSDQPWSAPTEPVDPRWGDDLAGDLTDVTAPDLLEEILTGRLPGTPTPVRVAAGTLAGATAALLHHRAARRASTGRRHQRITNANGLPVAFNALTTADVGDQVDHVVLTTLDALNAGSPVPATFADAVVLARLRTEYASDVTDAHEDVHRRASTAWTAAVHAHRDDLLAGPLRNQLHQVLDAVRTLPSSDHESHEDTQLGLLANRYGELRVLQEDLLATAFPLGDTYQPATLRLEARVHEFRDADAAWPDWGWLLLAEDATHAPPPWPRDPVQRVLFAAQRDAWMPTATETAAAWAAASNAWHTRRENAAAEQARRALDNLNAHRAAEGLPPLSAEPVRRRPWRNPTPGPDGSQPLAISMSKRL